MDKIDQLNEFEKIGDIGISYGFGMKFSKDVIDKFSFGILNIHTGDLPKYRSRHPISWAMINGEREIGVTLHKIDEKIDCGFLIHKFYVDRSFLDDLTTIQIKIESALENEFPEAIRKFSNQTLEKLLPGNYLQRIDKVFSDVDPMKMSAKNLYSLFMSQKIYGGVNIAGKRKLECHIFNKDYEAYYNGYEIHRCMDGVLVALK